jgi:hypothetical protein
LAESLVVEFKEDLASLGGSRKMPHPWHSGGKLDDYAKGKLFKEIVAFANTSGGSLVLGVMESASKPPTATAIKHIPRCVELAEALERAAQSIDPPIPLLGVQGVPLQADGSGVLIFRIPASRTAPHRSTDKDCYIRRGTNSVPMSMREIRDMTLSSVWREDRLQKQFDLSAGEFSAWLPSPCKSERVKSPGMVGIRVTAVPIGAEFEVKRLFGRALQLGIRQTYSIAVTDYGSTFTAEADAIRLPDRERSIVRGSKLIDADQTLAFITVRDNGTVNVGFRLPHFEPRLRLRVGSLGAHAINALQIANTLRAEAGIPEC